MWLFACELNSPYPVGSDLRTPCAVGGLAHLWQFAFLHDPRSQRTLRLHDAQCVPSPRRRENVGFRLKGKDHEAPRRRFTLKRGLMSAAVKTD